MAKSKRGKKNGPGRPPKAIHEGDAEGNKAYPYSIRATMRSIREEWYPTIDGDAMNIGEFVAQTADILEKLKEKYPRHKGDAISRIERIMSGGQDINYFDLRYHAEGAKVPTCILYAFTHVLGDIARDGDRTNAVNFLDSVVAGVSAMRDFVRDHPSANIRDEFVQPHDDEVKNPRYDAKLDALRRASDEYHRTRIPRKDADGLVG